MFSKSLSDIKKDLSNGLGIKKSLSSSISKQDIEALNNFEKAIRNGAISYKEAFENYLSKTPQAIKRQANELIKLHNQQKLLNSQYSKGKISQEEYNKAMNINKANINAITNQTQRLTLAQKAATVASKALGTALNIALNVGLTLGISAIITGIEEIVNKQQESIEKIKEQAESGKTLVKDIGDLRKQYYELSNQVNLDSTAKQNLSNVTDELLKRLGLEGESIDYLIKKYGTLDNAINKTTLDTLQTTYSSLVTAYGEAEKALYNTSLFKNSFGEVSIEHIAPDIAKFIKESEFSDLYDGGALIFDISNKDEVINTYETIDKLIKELNKNFSANDLKNLYVYDQLTILYGELSDNIKTYNTAISDLNKNLSEQQIITYLQGNTLPKTKDEFDSFIDTIVKTSIASEKFIGTEEEIKNSITAVLQSMPEFNDFFVQEQTDVQNTTDSIYKLKQATEELKTALDEAFSNQSTLQSAFDKIKEGSSLSADEVRKLIELCPELASEFTKTADGYTIDSQKLIDANDAVVESTKKSIQERADYLRSFINNDYNTGNINGAFEAKQYDEWKKSVESAKSELNGLELLLSMFGLTVDETKDKVKDLDDKYKELTDSTSNLVGKAKTLSSAFAEQNENGKLSTETVLSLIENGYAAALMYDKKTGAIRLNAQAYLDLANAEIEAQIADLKAQKAIADNTVMEAKKSIVSNLGWSYLGTAQAALELEKAQKLINDATADVSGIDAQIKALEDYKGKLGDITNGTYGGSGGSSTDSNKEAFDAANDLRKHWIAMGKDNTGKKYTEDMYYAWLDSADGYKKYFSDLEKYQDEYNKYEEEIYKWRLEQDNKLFEQKLENNEKLIKEIKNGEYDDPLQKYDELAKTTENSLKLVQARIEELIASGSGAVQDEIDSLNKQAEELQDDLAEIEKDKLKTRVENEKTFWEQQKEAVETYYDNELKNLEKIEDEQERINKKEELRLNLIKAQKELLDAKKNRNQLLFADGGFYYDYDQEAVQNAQENVTKAQQDITDFNNDETKRLLEEQRDNEIEYYNTIIEMLEAYINKTLPIESSDSEIFNTAMNSKYAQSVLEKKNNITKPITPVTLENILQNMGFKYNKEVVSAGYDLLGNVMSNSLKMPFGILDAYSKMNAQNYTVNRGGVSINNPSFAVSTGLDEGKVRAICDEEMTNAANYIADRIDSEATRVKNS